MQNSKTNRNALNIVTNQPSRQKSTDPLAKIRPIISKKPHLTQPLSRSNPIQISSGLSTLNTRISCTDNSSYQPLVTISDNEHSDDEDFIKPIQKLTQEELREELKVFKSNSTNHRALITVPEEEEAGELQFRLQQPFKRSICCPQYSFKESSCAIF